ncbi:hypothetical protein ACFOEE_12410 [Pseudoalteromonas fenneropenaei]|uniref:ParB/Sulfiredoxin domain-containing protein n=1 Tax=Pseudoalteromonas fenneropenaei TaxID=1737459 RepID=A0ABV7CKZ9_9GAMM
MGRARKVALKDLLLLPEINSRDFTASRSIAERRALINFREERIASLVTSANNNIKDTSQGIALSSTIPPLVVASLPKDLPKGYATKIKDKQYVLVDGYIRYDALGSAFGLDLRVPIEIVNASSMAELMTLNLDLNDNHPIPLTLTQKRAQIFRMMLHGHLFDLSLSQLETKYAGTLSKSAFGNYRSLATWVRETLNLEGEPYESYMPKLVKFTHEILQGLLVARFDDKGYPTKPTLSACRDACENGLDKLIEQKEAALEKRLTEASLVANEIRKDLSSMDNTIKAQMFSQLAAEARQHAQHQQTNTETLETTVEQATIFELDPLEMTDEFITELRGLDFDDMEDMEF